MKEEVQVDQQKRWTEEFALARKGLEKWHKEGEKVVKKFLDERGDDNGGGKDTRLNLFFSNIVTLKAMLYGSMPKVEVDRTFADANDDAARVASLMVSRILQQDIQYSGEDFASALRNVLEDRLLPGLGTARVKYSFKEQEVQIPAQMDPLSGVELAPAVTETKIVDETAEICYVFWKDLLYSPCRTYADMKWKAYRAYMNRKELVERFGEDVGNKIPMDSRGPGSKDNNGPELQENMQAEVWEIWSKDDKTVYWFVENYTEILDSQLDTLELDAFFPDPRPMTANTTTTKFVPRSDYALSQDLYNEIDILQSRISLLTEACKLVGVYDKQNDGIKRIFNEGVENDLIPVDNWAMFAEKGGLKGSIDWVPIEMVAKTIEILDNRLAAKVQQLYEITGMSDIIRGASQPYEAAATSKVKAQFASIRVQALQDDFARFASDLQSIKMEIIQKHFQPENIIEQSNIMMTPDAQLAPQAVQLLKDRKKARWRITIRPESLALADYAQLKSDRMEYIMGTSQFMQSMAPLVQLDKRAVPTLLELLKWGLTGFKGSNEIEGVMDRAVKMFTDLAKQPEQPKPDPAMMKVQAEMKLSQQEHAQKMQQEQGRMANEAAEFQQKMQFEREKFMLEMEQDKLRFGAEMAQMREKMRLELMKIKAGLIADRQKANTQHEMLEHEKEVQMESRDSETGAD